MKFYCVTYVIDGGMPQQIAVAASGIQDARRRVSESGVEVTRGNSVVRKTNPPVVWVREIVESLRAAMDESRLDLTERSVFEAMLREFSESAGEASETETEAQDNDEE